MGSELERVNWLNDKLVTHLNRITVNDVEGVLREWRGTPPIISEIRDHIIKQVVEQQLGEEFEIHHKPTVMIGEKVSRYLRRLIREDKVVASYTSKHRDPSSLPRGMPEPSNVYMHKDRWSKETGYIPHKEYKRKA